MGFKSIAPHFFFRQHKVALRLMSHVKETLSSAIVSLKKKRRQTEHTPLIKNIFAGKNVGTNCDYCSFVDWLNLFHFDGE